MYKFNCEVQCSRKSKSSNYVFCNFRNVQILINSAILLVMYYRVTFKESQTILHFNLHFIFKEKCQF